MKENLPAEIRFDERRRRLEAPELAEPLSRREVAAAAAIETLCLPLGPYRNLTTLTAALIAFHPKCVVLNHAAMRILPDRELDIFASPDADTWRRFIQTAIRLARHGGKGMDGGSILQSHAFNDTALREAHRERFGGETVSNRPRLLFWKDSQVIGAYLRHLASRAVGLDGLGVAIRFVVPVRNPLACARSNFDRKSVHRLFPGLAPTSEHEMLDRLLDIYVDLAAKSRADPDRYFLMPEPAFTRQGFIELANFLGIEADEDWLDTAERLIRPRRETGFPAGDWQRYAQAIDTRFDEFPHMRKALRAFVPPEYAP